MYSYVTRAKQKEVTELSDMILRILQDKLRNYFTFDIRLIGSGDKRLITKDGRDGSFDLDYNLILQKDKYNLLSNPKKIKELFLNELNKINGSYGFKAPKNSTSVITSNKIVNGNVKFSMDIAIMHKGNNGSMYKLIYDKNRNNYIWNEVKKSRNYAKRFKLIKSNGYWDQFKKRYLKLKNDNLRKQSKLGSYSIFLKTLDEIYDKYI